MVPPVKMMWTRFWLMAGAYLLGVTTFFFGSTPLAALLPAVLVLFVLVWGTAVLVAGLVTLVAAGFAAVLLVALLAVVLLLGLVAGVAGFAVGFAAGLATGAGAWVVLALLAS